MWRPIEELPQLYKDTRKMFVVRGYLPYGNNKTYTSDPYCVWLNKPNTEFVRWPHPYPPTEFVELPC